MTYLHRVALAGLKDPDQASLSKQKYVSPFPIAVAYTGLVENDRAFEALEKAYSERSWGMGMLEVNPVFDPLRSDPRFPVLLRRVNLTP